MALELAALNCEFANLCQGEYLEASAVRQDWPVPGLELVKASGLAERLQSGTKVQVVSVAQDYLGAYVFLQLFVVDSLDGTHGSHRHENGRVDAAVGGSDHSCPGA